MAEKTTVSKTSKPAKAIPSPRTKVEVSAIPSPMSQLQNLQQTLGNQVVQRLYRSGRLQAALKIDKPDDVFEQEADKVAAGLVLRKADKLVIRRQCAQPAGKVIFYLRASGINVGASSIRQGGEAHFYNLDNKIHRIKIVPANLFMTNSLNVNPGAKVIIQASSTTTQKNGSIVDDVPAATSNSVHDVIVCP